MFDLARAIGFVLLVVGAFFGWGDFITSKIMQCGDGRIPVNHWSHGVYCVQAEKWKP